MIKELIIVLATLQGLEFSVCVTTYKLINLQTEFMSAKIMHFFDYAKRISIYFIPPFLSALICVV